MGKRKAESTEMDRLLPEDLRIGMRCGTKKDGTPDYIKEIHEICAMFDGPHVHILSQEGVKCLAFSRRHTTYNPRRDAQKRALIQAAYSGGPGKLKNIAKDFTVSMEKMKNALQAVDASFPTNPNIEKLRKDFKVKGTITGRIPR